MLTNDVYLLQLYVLHVQNKENNTYSMILFEKCDKMYT